MLFFIWAACTGAVANGAFAACTTDDDCSNDFQCLRLDAPGDTDEPGDTHICTLECITEDDCRPLGTDPSIVCDAEFRVCLRNEDPYAISVAVVAAEWGSLFAHHLEGAAVR